MRSFPRFWIFPLLLIVAWIAAASANEPAARNPLATAQDIRTARTAGTSTVYRFTFRNEAGADITLLVASDYAITGEGQAISIHDFHLRRLLALDVGARQFINRSAYSTAGFADYELHNRQLVKGILAAGGADVLKAAPPSVVDDFWIETDLSHSKRPEDMAGASVKWSGNEMAVEYSGQTVAVFKPAEQQLPADVVSRFYRALRHVVALHPGIMAEMRKTGRLPKQLDYTSWRPMQDKKQHQLSLIAVAETVMDYPLTVDYVAKADDRLHPSFRTHHLPLVTQALIGDAVDPRPTADAYRQAIAASLAAGQSLDAALLALEMSLALTTDCSVNSDICSLIQDTFSLAQHDDGVKMLLAAKNQEQNNQKQAAIDTLRKIPRAGLRYGHILDLFIANNIVDVYQSRMTTAREADRARFIADAVGYFAAALEGNSFLAGTYKDLGQFYFHQFYAQEAWFLWDAGRSLPGRTAPNLLDAVGVFEQSLEQNYPWLF